jgi:hypothetical protein
MFSHDLCHSQIEYFSLRLVDPTARRAIQQIFNIQFRLVRVGSESFVVNQTYW